MSCSGALFCHVTVEVSLAWAVSGSVFRKFGFILFHFSGLVDFLRVAMFLFLSLSYHELLIRKCLFALRVNTLGPKSCLSCSWNYVSVVVIVCDVLLVTCLAHVLVLRDSWWTSNFLGFSIKPVFSSLFLFFFVSSTRFGLFPRTARLHKCFILKSEVFPWLGMISECLSLVHVEGTGLLVK